MEDSENPRVSPRMNSAQLITELQHISNIIIKMADPDIFTWLPKKRNPDETEIIRSSTIIADRLCGAVADPIIRNAQEKRQLAAISELLQSKGYSLTENGRRFNEMTPGSFSFHTNIPVYVAGEQGEAVNIPVDVAIMPLSAQPGDMPVLLEAKSAGDFTNVNKRRKEEAVKMQSLFRLPNAICVPTDICLFVDFVPADVLYVAFFTAKISVVSAASMHRASARAVRRRRNPDCFFMVNPSFFSYF